jgi:hypothetical protein
MRKVTTDPAIENNSQFAEAVTRATRWLEEEIGPAAERVDADWRLTFDDRQRPLLELRLGDWAGEARTTFAPDDLQRERHTRYRFIRLWGDVLQSGTQRLVGELQRGGGDSPGG